MAFRSPMTSYCLSARMCKSGRIIPNADLRRGACEYFDTAIHRAESAMQMIAVDRITRLSLAVSPVRTTWLCRFRAASLQRYALVVTRPTDHCCHRISPQPTMPHGRPSILAGFQKRLRPAGVQILVNSFLAAKLGNAGLASRAYNHDSDLLFGCMPPAGCTTNVSYRLLGTTNRQKVCSLLQQSLDASFTGEICAQGPADSIPGKCRHHLWESRGFFVLIIVAVAL